MASTTPIETMAQCAKEKLQASARELWSSIRSSDDSSGRETSKDESDSPTESAAAMSLEKIGIVLGVMFGSCTSGMPNIPSSSDPVPASPSAKPSRRQRSGEFVSSRDMGEHVYAQLFNDDHDRAAKAVDGLREKASKSSNSKSPARKYRDVRSRNSPRKSSNAPPATKAVDVSDDFSFDDGISAISAQTLEEMARVYDHKKKNSSPRQGNMLQEISYPISRSKQSSKPSIVPPKSPSVQALPSPLQFSRGRSSGTQGSKATKSSKGTQSTHSTQDSEFASAWRKEEQKYWDDVVEQDKRNSSFTMKPGKASRRKSRRSCSGSHATKVTATTASSSSFSNFSAYVDKQPNEIFRFDTKDRSPSLHLHHANTSLDHSKIQRKLSVALHASQLGEI